MKMFVFFRKERNREFNWRQCALHTHLSELSFKTKIVCFWIADTENIYKTELNKMCIAYFIYTFSLAVYC